MFMIFVLGAVVNGCWVREGFCGKVGAMKVLEGIDF